MYLLIKILMVFFICIIANNSVIALEIRIAASNASPSDKKKAQFKCDGINDAKIITDVIANTPEEGATIILSPGTFTIRKNSCLLDGDYPLGGIIIKKSNITLLGSGKNTVLFLAPEQRVNIIRIYSKDQDLNNIHIANLTIDGNVKQNSRESSLIKFETTGIKSLGYLESDTTKPDLNYIKKISNVTINNVNIFNTASLGVFLGGENVVLSNSILGESSSHSVEILFGPGKVFNNHFIINGDTLNVMATDAAHNVIFNGNTVTINSGNVGSIFSTWPGYSNVIFSENIVHLNSAIPKVNKILMDRGKNVIFSNNVINLTYGENFPPNLFDLGENSIMNNNIIEKRR